MLFLIEMPENELERESRAFQLWPKRSQKVYQKHTQKSGNFTLSGGIFIVVLSLPSVYVILLNKTLQIELLDCIIPSLSTAPDLRLHLLLATPARGFYNSI